MTGVREPSCVRPRGGVLAAAALGGLLGGAAHCALGSAFPAPGATFPGTTFAVNVSGAFVPAPLLVYVFWIRPAIRYVRPFPAVGFLSAFTAFSFCRPGRSTPITCWVTAATQPRR